MLLGLLLAAAVLVLARGRAASSALSDGIPAPADPPIAGQDTPPAASEPAVPAPVLGLASAVATALERPLSNLGADQPSPTSAPASPQPRATAAIVARKQSEATPSPVPTVLEVERESTLLLHDPGLERVVLDVIGEASATYGVAIKELSSGRGVLINPEREFYAASLFKLPIMYEVFRQHSGGSLKLDETLEFTERHVDFDLGTLDRGVGDAYSLGQALERMVIISDNSSAILLQDRVGAWRANQSMQALGLMHTFVLSDRLTTAPRDMLVFFQALARQEAVDRMASAGMVHLLLRQKINDRLPALLPRDTPVAHKTGNWTDNVHDVGIIYGPHATIVIAVLTEQVDSLGGVAKTIARLGRAVYDYFDQLPTTSVPVPEDPRLSWPKLEAATPTPTPTATAGPGAPTPAASRTATRTTR